MKITIVGGGNIGGALAKALCQNGTVLPKDLTIVEHNQAKLVELTTTVPCNTLPSLNKSIETSAVVILAIKPQDTSSLFSELKGYSLPNALIISVMAGVTLTQLGSAFNQSPHLIRAMPNTPLAIGLGMTVYVTSANTTKEPIENFEAIFGSFGRTIRVADEALLDSATALSGTGPAYVFYLIEKMIEAGQELGFSQDESELMVYQTLRGATELWHQSGQSAPALRAAVTSKGGTTQAAFDVFDSQDLGKTISDGIKQAMLRCRELSLKK